MSITRYYKHPESMEVYQICSDEFGYLVILPNGNTQAYGTGYSLNDVEDANGLLPPPYKVEEKDGSCR